MSATAQAVGKAIDIAVLVLLGDKLEAAKQREISRTLQDVFDGKITEDEAIAQLRPKRDDALDQALGNSAE